MYYCVEFVNLLLLLWHCAFALNFTVLRVAVFFIALIISTCVTDPVSPILTVLCCRGVSITTPLQYFFSIFDY